MINRHRLTLYKFESAFKEKNKTFWKKINVWSTENWKCYNCEVIKHLVRDCIISYCERKELVIMNKKVMHNQLSWTVYYNNMYWIHWSFKNEVR